MGSDFVEILKEILILNSFKQQDLAELIGVKQSQISEWLHGKAKPGYDTIKKICIALDISADYLLGLSNIDKKR